MKIYTYILTLSVLFTGQHMLADEKQKFEKFVTQMDFDSASVDGKMKAPSGFYLQGRNKQSLKSMVKLRTDFRDRLRNSKSAVKSISK